MDEDIPSFKRNIEDELPKPIGIYGKNVHNSIFINNTFVGIPTPFYIEGSNNFFWNNRSFPTRLRRTPQKHIEVTS